MKWLEIIVGIRMEALGGMSALLSMMSPVAMTTVHLRITYGLLLHNTLLVNELCIGVWLYFIGYRLLLMHCQVIYT